MIKPHKYRSKAYAPPSAVRRAVDVAIEMEREGVAFSKANIVARARTLPDTDPLHRYFEWSDHVAGHKYRLLQAGRLIQLTVQLRNGDAVIDGRAFWSVRASNKRDAPGVYLHRDQMGKAERGIVHEDLWGRVRSAVREAISWRLHEMAAPIGPKWRVLAKMLEVHIP